jgi:hypothetical protein
MKVVATVEADVSVDHLHGRASFDHYRSRGDTSDGLAEGEIDSTDLHFHSVSISVSASIEAVGGSDAAACQDSQNDCYQCDSLVHFSHFVFSLSDLRFTVRWTEGLRDSLVSLTI